MNPRKRQTAWAAAFLIFALALVAGIVRLNAPPATVGRLEHQQQMQQRELQQRFEQAAVMLHAKQYDHAITALHRVLQLAPRLPEAHVNMGYALVGLEKYDAARGFFEAAIELNPRQANAYYGLALTQEAGQDYESALGAMRTYLHFAPADDPHRTRARSALWEWEAKLGRHPAGTEAAAVPTAPTAPPRP
ncbi:tetratricopeptide repeat protein [Ramlibacter alkalitolerans]|jgi:tetratricopeptide (TPR) repeat protein|uniref:Tetratricopeptide repeat protein n=1 Tax=Ramlibacter alkalitolerans TaxID=2039631 RepID=A0ABS1JJ84_9BURK|nr:tetratricopeptide repeat protein [Ramlibacter alkalitolerans]MBL0424161.1 tetratricopeptide repeat protein [Ramlibacter alkalitolerans]